MIVLVTGASGGLGSVLAQTLTAKGMTVFGTSRNVTAADKVLPYTLLSMQVDDDESIAKCINQIVEREGRLDVLINCVNEMIIGSIEEQTVEEVASVYRTNVFGMLRVCQQVIPVMRKQGKGVIVNMSSLGGLLAVPYMSAYTSSKFALEAMSEAMYHELKSDNIEVVIMQPVAMNMDRPDTGGHLQVVSGAAESSPSFNMLKKMSADTAASKLTPQHVADKIHQVIMQDKKPLRVPMDKARAISILKRIAPQSLINKIVGGLLK